MSTRLRNPSPPPGDTDFLRNMHIWYLKPTFSLQPLELSLDLFNKNLFLTPNATDDELTSTEINIPSIKEETSVTPCVSPESPQLKFEKEIYGPKNAQAPKKENETAQAMDIVENIHITSKRAHKKDVEKDVLKHKAVKKESITGHDRKRYRKSSKHEKKRVPDHSFNSDSDESESSKPKKHHEGHRRRKHSSLSETGDSDSERALRKTHKTKTRGRHEKRRELVSYSYSESESESNSRPSRHHKRYKNYKKECDGSYSDGSNSRGSAEDKRSRHYKYAYDTSDSDSRRSEWDYKTEHADESRTSESKYIARFSNSFISSNYNQEDYSYFGPDNFYCKVCQLDLNSESSYQSHMKGKKHAKAIKAQKIPEIVKGSLATVTITKEILRPAFVRSKLVDLDEESKLQGTLANITNHPIIGLNYIQEIIVGKDTQYYCELCDSPCMTASILPHLIGFKHQMSYLKVTEPGFYHKFKDYHRKDIIGRVYPLLFKHEKLFGRGNITVKAVADRSKTMLRDEAGPSSSNQGTVKDPLNKVDDWNTEVLGPEDFDPEIFEVTKTDYYCKLCDAHMNNVNMYSAHKVGKRHLKNEKKTARERRAQISATRAPAGTVSQLETNLKQNTEDVIVGLNFIRETQSANGSLYTCYICGASGTIDIIDHICTLKHRIRYLEKVNENGSIPNSIASINELQITASVKENLVLEECERIEKQYGRGKVEIYVSKYLSS